MELLLLVGGATAASSLPAVEEARRALFDPVPFPGNDGVVGHPGLEAFAPGDGHPAPAAFGDRRVRA
jgi:hypothetical protein